MIKLYTLGRKTRPLALTLALFFNLSSPAQAASNICYAVADNGNRLVQTDRTPVPNAVFNDIGAAGVSNIEAIALYIDGVTLYAADANTLGTMNTTTGVFTAVAGTFGSGDGADGNIIFSDVDSLGFDYTTGIFYGANRRNGSRDVLFQIDRNTGLAVPNAFGAGVDYVVIDTAGLAGTIIDVDDIAIHAVTGQMYAVANDGGTEDHLITIDKATGAIADVDIFHRTATVLGNEVEDIEGLSFYNDGTLYAVTGQNSNASNDNIFFTVDIATAQMTDILSFPSYGDYEAVACLSDAGTDFGDNPASYSDASHVFTSTLGTLYLGSAQPDGEFATQGNDGFGDDNDESDEEDGVIFSASGGALGQEVTAHVSVINDSGADAYLCGWIDENLDGDFDASEASTCSTMVDNNGIATTVDLTWTGLPETQGTTYARFRLCNTLSLCGGPSDTPSFSSSASATDAVSEAFTDGSGTSCVTPVIRTFSIADSFTIDDLNLDLNITHTFRDDFNITLESPAGTVLTLTTRDTIGSGADNIGVVFDDEAGTSYNSDTANHTPITPLRLRSPQNPLSIFDGEDSAGDWILNMCDSWGGDTGNFNSATLNIFGASTGGPALTGEVEDYRIDFDFSPTAVTMGDIELEAVQAADFLSGLKIDEMSTNELLALIAGWDYNLAASLTNANKQTIIKALHNYLDPDEDGQIAVLRWTTIEERGTIGFYVERRQAQSTWTSINNEMLPGLISAPLGGEYQLADPSARTGQSYEYQLIEIEMLGTRQVYGPYSLEMQ